MQGLGRTHRGPLTRVASAGLAGRPPDPFAALNPDQRAAVEHGDAPLLVVAGAGTGKTSTLAARVARLVLNGADPQRLLLLTFSRRAAHEMQQRTGRMLHQALGLRATQRPPVLPWAGTFHSVGARLLRELAPRLGLAPDFTVVDRGDAEGLMGLMRQDLGLAAARSRFPLAGTCLAIYSRCVNSQEPLAQVLEEHFPWCAHGHDALRRLFGAYVAEKQRQHTLDYDDLLLAWQQALAEPTFAGVLGERFAHVLVDEYQDTNRLQAAILHALKPDGRGLTVVGDDAQAIYGFRAAEVRNILEFAQHWGSAARVLPLQRNYRSTAPILEASNAIIALAAQRLPKQLWTERSGGQRPQLVTVADELAQASWVAEAVLARREQGLALRQQAVLFRTTHHSAVLELELARRRVPFVKYGGLKFLEAAHIKDVLAALRWAENPRSRITGFRVAQLVPGIGPAHARRLLDAMDASAEPLRALDDWAPPPGARADWAELQRLLQQLRPGRWPDDLAAVRRWYQPHLQRLHDADAPVRALDLDALERLASGHGSRERFLTELTIDPPEATSDEAGPPHLDEDYLVLSTIHSAKGQEWAAVVLLNVIDGCMPSDMAAGSTAGIEEERRLLYVAMTRARDHLALMVPQRFHVTEQPRWGDRHLYGGRSRFIPADLLEQFEACSAVADAASPDAVAPASEDPPAIDLQLRLRSAWL